LSQACAVHFHTILLLTLAFQVISSVVKAHCAAANITLKYSDCAIPPPSTSTLALDKMDDTGAAQGDAPQPKAFKAKPLRRRRPGAAKDIDISDLYFTYVPEITPS
jgi:hypothetical protein